MKMAKWELERDSRQYQLMLDRLSAFERKAIGLPDLVEDLRSLIDALSSTNRWAQELLSDWWTLEQVYAVAIDRDQLQSLPQDSEDLVKEAITALRDLLARAVAENQAELKQEVQ